MRRILVAALLLAGCTAAPRSPSQTPASQAPEEPARVDTARAKPVRAIQLLAPAGGETWREGETHTIRWKAEGVSFVDIGCAMGGHDKGHLATHVPAASGAYDWTIPAGFVSGFGPDAGNGVMRIRIEDSDDPERFGENRQPFSILGPG